MSLVYLKLKKIKNKNKNLFSFFLLYLQFSIFYTTCFIYMTMFVKKKKKQRNNNCTLYSFIKRQMKNVEL